jgi:hypothetical protein
MDGDDAIKALATAVDSRVGVHAAGLASLAFTAGLTQVTVAITFPAGRFTAPPVLTFSWLTAPAGTNAAWLRTTSTTVPLTGFSLVGNVLSAPSQTYPVGWHAIQVD